MEKRYQVFVSSTYEDLQEERQEVMHALLELDCIPAGMELFPAANEDQWTLIKKVIDDCDYYIVIIAGRYGSIGPGGISYTEMEYQYAEDAGNPTIAFLHKDPESLPAKRTERSEGHREKLRQFRTHVEQKMCKYWTNPAELGSVVSRSLVRLIKTTPAVGWVRADEVPDTDVSAENTRLRMRLDELEAELAEFAAHGPEGTENLAQGDDKYTLDFVVSVYDADTYKPTGPGEFNAQLTTSWYEIMRLVLPAFIIEGEDRKISWRLTDLYREHEGHRLLKSEGGRRRDVNVSLSGLSQQQIVVQLRALGLVTPSIKRRSLRDSGTYWKLTPYGATVMTRLCALRRDSQTGLPNHSPQRT